MFPITVEAPCASPCPLQAAVRCFDSERSPAADERATGGTARVALAVPVLGRHTTPGGLQVTLYALPLAKVPADFFADPDGSWSFEALASAAGFAAETGVAIGALAKPFNGHPDGAAVVTLNREDRPYVAIVECPVAYETVASEHGSRASAA